MVQDVDCFVLLLGWAAYAWDTRRVKLTHALRHSSHGTELRRLCNLACCSEAVRTELQDAAMLNSVAEAAVSQHSEATGSEQGVRHPASVQVPERRRCQARDMLGVSPGLQPAPAVSCRAQNSKIHAAARCAHVALAAVSNCRNQCL